MEEVEYGEIVVGVIWILGGILYLFYPKLVYGYRKWTKEKQESFNIKGFARLLGVTFIIAGISLIVSSFFGCADRIFTIGVFVIIIVIVFIDRLFYKKKKHV